MAHCSRFNTSMADVDIAIIGGGIIGCSVLFELEQQGYNCNLLEKNGNLMSEASSGNSGMLHTGFDAPANSLELQCIKHCLGRVFGVFDKLGVPYNKNGSVMVAWNPEQVSRLNEIKASSKAKDVKGVFDLPLPELYRKEPWLSKQAQGALWIPEETVLEPCVYGLLLAHHARKNGAKLLTDCEVQGVQTESIGMSTLITSQGLISAKVIINCAGLYGDKVQQLAGIETYTIHPRKGQYTVFGRDAGHLINSSILPVPTERTKGMIVFKTVYDNIVVGPTAEDTDSRLRAPVDPRIAKHLLNFSQQTVPELTNYSPVGHYTGVRPATQFKDYQIKSHFCRNWVDVGGIRSTGVSASLGIAEHVASLVKNDLHLEPSRGSTHAIEPSDWKILDTGVLSVDGIQYGIAHPITLFGMQKKKGISRL